MIRILFVAANPIDTSPLRLGEEVRDIQAKLRAAERRSDFELRSAWAVRTDDLIQQMNEFRPSILHFSGHGSSAGDLILEDSTGRARPISPESLKGLLSNFKRWLRVVVLNACYSETQANALLEAVGIVIAMRSPIADNAAINFAASFYRALGFDRSIQEAFDQAVSSLQLEGIPQEDVPVLMHRPDIDPSRLTITDPGNLAESARRASDPHTPANIRKLLEKGTELIVLNDGPNEREPSDADRILLKLSMRQSPKVFIIEANRNSRIGITARKIAQRLLPDMDTDDYDWTFEKGRKTLPEYHTLALAGLQAGDNVKLIGNHTRPQWAPRMASY